MRNSDRYVLHTKDFESTVTLGWRELRNDVDFYDMAIACDDQQANVHKIVISTWSPVLKNILKNNPLPNPIIYLRGVSYFQLTNVIDFMYRGEIKIPCDYIDDFFNVAKDLKVIGLTETSDEHDEEIIKVTDNAGVKEPPNDNIDLTESFSNKISKIEEVSTNKDSHLTQDKSETRAVDLYQKLDLENIEHSLNDSFDQSNFQTLVDTSIESHSLIESAIDTSIESSTFGKQLEKIDGNLNDFSHDSGLSCDKCGA